MSWILNHKRKLAKLFILSIVIFVIGVFNMPLAVVVLLIIIVVYKLNKFINDRWYYYIQHPALTNLKRNYDNAIFGSTACYLLKAHGEEKSDLKWALPLLSFIDLKSILYRYYSLVKSGGTISLYIKSSEIASYWNSDKHHPFVQAILHNWTDPEKDRCHDWKLLIKDFSFTIALLGFRRKAKKGEFSEMDIERINELKNFLQERDRDFKVILDSDDYKYYSSLFKAKKIDCIENN